MNSMSLKSAFETYVARHVADADRAQTLLHTAEDLLPDFIRRNIDENFTTLYDVSDKAVLKDYIERIILDPILKSEDASVNDVGYISALTLYRRFMKSPMYGQLKDEEVEDVGAEPPAVEHQTARSLVEGAILQDEHCTGRERNLEAREQCIAYYRTLHKGHVVCECCGFDFEKAYGEMGRGFIEVHHRFPLSQTDGEHEVNPETDLVPLCSNCHSMIHRLAARPGDCISLEELRSRYIGKRYF